MISDFERRLWEIDRSASQFYREAWYVEGKTYEERLDLASEADRIGRQISSLVGEGLDLIYGRHK